MSGCGGCTQCCKTMAIPEMPKASNEWCKHCDKGVGCGIYESRPDPCRKFKCLWLLASEKGPEQAWPDRMRPDISKVVVNLQPKDQGAVFHVDPDRPDAWATDDFKKLAYNLAANNLSTVVIVGRKIFRIRRSEIAT